MAERDVERIRQVYADFARGDIDAVLAAFHDDIEWIEPDGYFPGARGTHRGVEAVREIFAVYPRHWDEFSVEMEEYVDAGDQVVVLGRSHFKPRGGGERRSSRLCNVWTMRDGKASRLVVFNDTALIWRALGGGDEYWAT